MDDYQHLRESADADKVDGVDYWLVRNGAIRHMQGIPPRSRTTEARAIEARKGVVEMRQRAYYDTGFYTARESCVARQRFAPNPYDATHARVPHVAHHVDVIDPHDHGRNER